MVVVVVVLVATLRRSGTVPRCRHHLHFAVACAVVLRRCDTVRHHEGVRGASPGRHRGVTGASRARHSGDTGASPGRHGMTQRRHGATQRRHGRVTGASPGRHGMTQRRHGATQRRHSGVTGRHSGVTGRHSDVTPARADTRLPVRLVPRTSYLGPRSSLPAHRDSGSHCPNRRLYRPINTDNYTNVGSGNFFRPVRVFDPVSLAGVVSATWTAATSRPSLSGAPQPD